MILRKKYFSFLSKTHVGKMFDKYNKHKKHGPNLDQESKIHFFFVSELKPIL